MAKTISTLAYMVTADTRSLVEGLTATKKELRAAEQIMKAARSPAEEYQDALRGIEALAAKMPPELFDAAKAVEALNKEFGEGTDETDEMAQRLMGMVPVIDPVSLSLKALSGAAELVGTAFNFITDKVGDSLGTIQEMGNAAQSLGTSVESFQVLQFAADQADVELETLKKGVFNLEKAIGDAEQPGSKLAKTFEELGLDFRQLKQLDPAQQLRMVVGALGEVPNRIDRTRLASDVLGKASLELQRLVDSGNAGFEDAEEHLKAIGFITAEDVNNVGELDGAWKVLNRSVDSVFNRLAADLAPALKDIVQDFDKFLQDPETQASIKGLAEDIKDLAHQLAIASDNLKPFGKGVMQGVTPGIRGALGAIPGANAVMDLFGMTGASDAAREAREAAREAERLDKQLRDLQQSRNNQEDKPGPEFSYDEFAQEMTPPDDTTVPRFSIDSGEKSEYTKRQEELKKLREEAKKLTESLRTPWEKAQEEIKKYQKMLDEGALTFDQFERAREKAEKDRDKTLQDLEREQKHREKQTKATKEATKAEKELQDLKKSVEATKVGSREAFEAIASAQGLLPDQFQPLKDFVAHQATARRFREAIAKVPIGVKATLSDAGAVPQKEREALSVQREQLDLLRKMQQGIGDGLNITVNEVTL